MYIAVRRNADHCAGLTKEIIDLAGQHTRGKLFDGDVLTLIQTQED